MRHWLALSLLCLQSLALLKPIAPMLFFQLQQAYIAQELCENRFSEMSYCGGQCVLQAALEKTFQSSEAPQERSEWRLHWLEQPSLLPLFSLDFSFLTSHKSPPPKAYLSAFLPADFAQRLEKPPRLV